MLRSQQLRPNGPPRQNWNEQKEKQIRQLTINDNSLNSIEDNISDNESKNWELGAMEPFQPQSLIPQDW